MRHFKYFIFILFIFSFGYANESFFKSRLKSATKGDFAVFEYNKIYSVLSVFDVSLDKVILEEITISKDSFDKKVSFRDWIESRAKEHTSWTMYEIDLKKDIIKDAFSISKNAWIDIAKTESVITKLLELDLKKIRDSERKKIGAPPLMGEVDRRSIWQPIKMFDGKKISRAKFDVYRSIWPDDNSVFSLKRFDIYFDDSFAFPYFIEVNNGHMSYMIKAIDSGKNIKSQIAFFPKRLAEMVEMRKDPEDPDLLTLKVKNADYKDFDLFAIDCTRKDKLIHTVDFDLKKEDDLSFFHINLNDLNEVFEKDHKYRFVIKPKFEKNIYIESSDLFIFK
ncbi:MAG: hypothetical protein KR126chlam6_00442 [Candidatus Anoxychlamydiales bacterium]|nr:hypothetical protein [Candidatus Anoxychlamydiales bacterium]